MITRRGSKTVGTLRVPPPGVKQTQVRQKTILDFHFRLWDFIEDNLDREIDLK
jgi:hypothetical protein